MCFGSKTPKPSPVAPAPQPPDPIAEEEAIGAERKVEDIAKFGTETPSLRNNRALTSGGVNAGGTGLRTM